MGIKLSNLDIFKIVTICLLALFFNCIDGEPEPIMPIVKLAGKTLRLMSIKIIHDKDKLKVQPYQLIFASFIVNKEETLKFSIYDYNALYKVKVPKETYSKGFRTIKWSTKKIKQHTENLADLWVLIEQKEKSIPIFYPALIFSDDRPTDGDGYQFKFRKRGEVRLDYKLVNSANNIMYEEENFMPSGEFFDIEWDGRDLNAIKASEGVYSLIVDVSFDGASPTRYIYKFYHVDF